MNVKDIITKFDNAMSEKEVWNALYCAVFRMTMPNRDSFYIDENIPNNWENTRLLTTVGCEAADTFASRFQRVISADGNTAVKVQAPTWWEDTANQRDLDEAISY